MEPLHIHVRRGECVAKYWILPEVVLAESYGMTSSELREIMGVVGENRMLIEEAWNEHFGN